MPLVTQLQQLERDLPVSHHILTNGQAMSLTFIEIDVAEHFELIHRVSLDPVSFVSSVGSAALVSLALFGAFVTTAYPKDAAVVDILQPFEFAGLIVGAMLPYWFSAMTMKAVGVAALDMVDEVRRQFRSVPTDANGEKDFSRFKADYSHCVRISTEASLRMMIAPGALVMLTPLIVGFVFGRDALAGVLAGALVSGVQMAISAANSGGQD